MQKFRSKKEFREVVDKLFSTMSRDPAVGGKLRAAQLPMGFEFSDVPALLLVRGADDAQAKKGHYLDWSWNQETWQVVVTLRMTADTMNRMFQGKLNIPLALAKKDVDAISGDVSRALELLPLVQPVFGRWSEHVRERWPHLVA